MKRIIFILLSFCAFSLHAQTDEFLSPNKHFQRADELYYKNNCAKALEHINKTIAADMEHWEAYQLRAMIYECLGKYDKAITDYSVLILWQPENPEFYFSRGELRYKENKFRMATGDLQKALSLPIRETNQIFFTSTKGEGGISGVATIQTLHSEMYNYLGLSLYELNEYDSAISCFTEALKLKTDSKYLNNRARCYEAISKWKKAAGDYEEALLQNEDDATARYNLILVYDKMGDLEKQRRLLSTTKSNYTSPELHIYKGINAYKSKNYRLALAYYDSAILIDNKEEEYHIYHGQANEKLNRRSAAIADYKAALQLDELNPKAYFGLGNVYYESEFLDSAKICYDLAILYDEKYYNAYLNRAIVYLRKDQKESACKDLSTAVEGELPGALNLFHKNCSEKEKE